MVCIDYLTHNSPYTVPLQSLSSPFTAPFQSFYSHFTVTGFVVGMGKEARKLNRFASNINTHHQIIRLAIRWEYLLLWLAKKTSYATLSGEKWDNFSQ